MTLHIRDMGLGEDAQHNPVLNWFLGILGIGGMSVPVEEEQREGEVLIGHAGSESETLISTMKLKH